MMAVRTGRRCPYHYHAPEAPGPPSPIFLFDSPTLIILRERKNIKRVLYYW